jgi:predicted DNA-binding ribbon-helix-helix protein
MCVLVEGDGMSMMEERPPPSRVVKRSIAVAGHKTSVSLEDAFWDGLTEIAIARGLTPSTLISSIAATRQHNNLSSAIRLFVFDYYRALAERVDKPSTT